ncbi:hypothetical protein PG984_010542 [Apiospora sp. TS-2023a]
MKITSVILLSCTSAYAASFSSLFERDINVCGWHLNGDDCICMNSQNGALLQAQTNTCCTNMGLNTKNAVSISLINVGTTVIWVGRQLTLYNKICTVAHDNRDTFKQCCKWLNQPSVIGHCR